MKIGAYLILTYSFGDFLTHTGLIKHHDDVRKKKGQMDNTMDKIGLCKLVKQAVAVYSTQPRIFRITDQRGNFSAFAAPPNIQCL